MEKYIALLRGINVGGKKSIKMTELKIMFESLKYKNILTYIQSGNIIFEANIDVKPYANKIEDEIKNYFGFEVPVILVTKKELHQVVDHNPFINETVSDIDNLHVTFFSNFPESKFIDELKTIDFNQDEFIITDKCLYLKCTGKYSDSKLTNTLIEKKLRVKATTRNWKTVLKLKELAQN